MLALAALLLVGGAGGCATVTIAPSDSRLSGQWQLDPAASDDTSAKVSKLIAAAQEKERKRRESSGYGTVASMPSGPGRGGGSRNGGQSQNQAQEPSDDFGAMLGPDFGELRSRLMLVLQVPPSLRIEVEDEEVSVAPGDAPPRDYHTGEQFSRIDEYGTGKINTSWSGKAFILEVRYSNRGTLRQQYLVNPQSDTLVLTRTLTDAMVGKVQLRSVYRRS